MPVTVKSTASEVSYNPTCKEVDSGIIRYLGMLAGRDPNRWCAPTLADIARSARTSPWAAQQRLKHFEEVRRVLPLTRIIDGEETHGWVVPRSRDWRAPKTAAAGGRGFNGADRIFMRACGIAGDG